MTDVPSEVLRERQYAPYYDMQAEAEKMHPDMHVHLKNGEWVFTLHTGKYDFPDVPDEFRDTYAWKLWDTADPRYGNKLERYRAENGLENMRLEVVFEHANLMKLNEFQQHLESEGLPRTVAVKELQDQWHDLFLKMYFGG